MQTITLSRGRPVSAVSQAALPQAAVRAPALDMHARADDAAALLKALANPGRLLLLCQLVDGELSVNALGSLTGIEQPTLSQQLGVLRGERLVATRRQGRSVLYRIASPAALAVLRTLYDLFCTPAKGPAPKRARKKETS